MPQNRIAPSPNSEDEVDETVSLLKSQRLAAQRHDSGKFEMKKNDSEMVEKINQVSIVNPMIETNIVCLFVVKFDLKIGYRIEYQFQNESYPIDLGGIEFKCLPSGTHKLDTDIVMFRHVHNTQEFFGMACVDIFRSEELDRGSRIRAMGVICNEYRGMMAHASFLKKLLAKLNRCDESLEGKKTLSDCIQKLNNYFTANDSFNGSKKVRLSEITKIEIDNHLHFGSLVSLFYSYRENIFTLWKALLLKKRVLISTNVPIGLNGCSKVHAIHFLTYFAPQQNMQYIEKHFGNDIVFGYYVSLNDYQQIAKQDHYLACTCDEILETKKECFDILIKEKEIIIHDKELAKILKKSSSDVEKTKMLDDLLSRIQHMSRTEQEYLFRKYFAFINNQTILFLAMNDSINKKMIVTEKQSGALSLCGDDILFVKELAELIGLDIEFSSGSSFLCCC